MKSSVYVQKNHTKEKFKKIAVIALAWAIVLFTVPGCESTSELKDSSANFTTQYALFGPLAFPLAVPYCLPIMVASGCMK